MAEGSRQQGQQRFSEEQVGEIIKRASTLQKKDPLGGREQGALSAAELETIAAEAGINPVHVRRAIADLQNESATRGSLLLGAPTSVRLERIIPGEVSPEAFEPMVDEIRREVSDAGTTSTLGRTLTWSSSPMRSTLIHVSISPRDGQTRISIDINFSRMAGGIMGGAGGGVGGGLGAPLGALAGQMTHSGLIGVGVSVGTLVLGLLLARTFFGSGVRRRVRSLQKLLDRLANQAESAIATP